MIVVLCLAFSLTGCDSNASKYPDLETSEVEGWQTNEDDVKYEQTKEDLGLKNMKKMATDGDLTLYFNEKTTEIAVQTKEGAVWYSNPQNRLEYNPNRLGTYSSQLLVTTIGTTNENVTEENNFDESVRYGQAVLVDDDKKDNSFKVKYLFGKKQSVPLYPAAMTVEKFEEILNKLTSQEQYKLKRYYSLVDMETLKDKPQEKKNIESKFANADELGQMRVLKNSPSTLEKKYMAEYMEKAGFTMEDKEEQERLVGYVKDEGTTNYYTVSIQYTLKDGRLVVDVPTEDIKTSSGITIQGITVLPHWNTSGGMASTQMLVPDGSGAIVNLGEIAASGTPEYQEKVYGRDYAQSQKMNTSEKKNVYFPMYGISNKDGSMYATATGADATAYMKINPCTNQKSPGYGGFYFQLLDTEQVRMSDEEDKTVTTYANEAVLDPIQVDFTFLPKAQNNWVDIAKNYRERLISEGKLATDNKFNQVPLSVEFLGAIDDIKTVMGVPTEYIKPLTTFDEAKEISMEMADNPAYKNNKLIVQYDAWFEGGAKSLIQSKVNTEGKVGSTSDMKDLADAVQGKNGAFYPLVDYQYVYRNNLFDGFTTNSDASRGILREASFKADFNVGNFMASEDGLYGYLLSPSKSKKTLNSFVSSYDSKLGLNTIGLSFAASDLSGDYSRGDFVTRNEAKKVAQELLAETAKEHSILSRGANEYALASLDVATQIPMESNRHPVISSSVPFTQMVLSGSIMYTAGQWNNEADTNYYILRCIETGSAPDFTLIASENSDVKYTKYDQYYAVNYNTIKGSMETVVTTVTEALSDVYGQKMVAYDRPANNVVVVTYENGCGVVVNYGNSDYTYSNGGVVKAGSYLKFSNAKGGNAQ